MWKHLVASLVLAAGGVGSAWADHPVRFTVQFLAHDANEGCDLADFDGDGKLDIVAGRNWYRNGTWTPRPVRLIDDWSGYAKSNGEWAHDVNGDGRPDVISMDFTGGEVFWYENPGGDELLQGYLWPPHLLADTGQKTNEVSDLVDLDGDGKPEWFSNQWTKTNPAIIWKFGQEEREVAVAGPGGKSTTERQVVPVLVGHTIGAVSGHGVGYGDINNDGRLDLLFGLGWYEGPASGDPLAQEWTYHADWDIHGSCPMQVRDVNGDGVNDLIWSNAHDYGLYLWLGKGLAADGKLAFEQQTIDDSFSQAHCLVYADLDGDGNEELITGKRIRAHNGKDPGAAEPPTVRYYVWNSARNGFDAHIVNEGQAGGGLQIRTADLDGDGDIDIVAAGKEGTKILWNQGG